MNGWLGSVALVFLLAVPVVLVWRYVRKPTVAPRDSIAMKGKAEMKAPVHILGSDAGEDLVGDAAEMDEHR